MATYITSNIQTYNSLHQFIDWLDDRRVDYIKVKQWFANFMLTLLLLPLIFVSFLMGIIVLRFILKLSIWFIIPKINLDIPNIPLDKDIYVAYRNLYDTINKDLGKLKELQDTFQKKEIPLFLTSGLRNDFAKIVDSLLNWHVQIENALKSMDFPVDISISPFQNVTENELWNNRNHAYQYLM